MNTLKIVGVTLCVVNMLVAISDKNISAVSGWFCALIYGIGFYRK